MSMSRVHVITLTLIVLPLIAPLIFYIWTFGGRLSSEHSRWGEFGSAMSGIYTPILTLLTISILVFQARLQKQMHDYNQTMAYIDQARTDIEFYVTRLESVFFLKISTGSTVREILHSQFQPTNIEALDSPMLRKIGRELNYEIPQLLALYHALQAVLVGLSTSQETPYQLNYNSAIQKQIALLSFETCVALENYNRTVTEGRIKGKYVFSPLLRD